jgi:hypothetical protein
MKSQLRLIACPHPLSIDRDRIDRVVPAGATIRQHAEALGWQDFQTAEAWIDDQRVPVANWQDIIPHPGQSLVLRAIPLDSGNGKTAIRIVALIAVVVAAAYTGGAAAGALGFAQGSAAYGAVSTGITAAFTIAGDLRINSFLDGPGGHS